MFWTKLYTLHWLGFKPVWPDHNYFVSFITWNLIVQHHYEKHHYFQLTDADLNEFLCRIWISWYSCILFVFSVIFQIGLSCPTFSLFVPKSLLTFRDPVHKDLTFGLLKYYQSGSIHSSNSTFLFIFQIMFSWFGFVVLCATCRVYLYE